MTIVCHFSLLNIDAPHLRFHAPPDSPPRVCRQRYETLHELGRKREGIPVVDHRPPPGRPTLAPESQRNLRSNSSITTPAHAVNLTHDDVRTLLDILGVQLNTALVPQRGPRTGEVGPIAATDHPAVPVFGVDQVGQATS